MKKFLTTVAIAATLLLTGHAKADSISDIMRERKGVDAVTVAGMRWHEAVCTTKERTESFKAARKNLLHIYRDTDAALIASAEKAIEKEAVVLGRGEVCRFFTDIIVAHEQRMANYKRRDIE